MCSLQTAENFKLSHFEVNGLFSEHDYLIPLNTEEHVTAIIAPNGTGKTLCLRLIAAFFERKWATMLGVDFDQLKFSFTNGKCVVIEKTEPVDLDADDESVSLKVTVMGRDGVEKIEWEPKMIGAKRKMSIERYLPFLTRTGSSNWRHDHSGQIFDFPDLVEEFGDRLPESIKTGLWGEIPHELLELTDHIECRLIETQRLLVINDDFDRHYYGNRPERASTLAIMKKAQALKSIIAKEINAYAAYSQSLDRTFPHRVISDETHNVPENLNAKLAELESKRAALTQAGILDAAEEEPVAFLPSGNIDPAVARVLQTYAVDTHMKLETLEPLLERINLFKKLIKQRFTTKDVQVDREHGIFVNARDGEIPLDKLSSGEQHQLVLFFELLFEIKENSLILIDEPELSLHVAWQKQFVGDLLGIIDLNKFDVVLATHSPQLVSHWEDLVVELGDAFQVSEDY
jgi:ABC-type Mn2+/Zn2+ transport system ATPase subunit